MLGGWGCGFIHILGLSCLISTSSAFLHSRKSFSGAFADRQPGLGDRDQRPASRESLGDSGTGGAAEMAMNNRKRERLKDTL